MPRYYVDLDNNKLVTGPQSTQLAPTPRLYQGDKPTLDLELLTRTNGVLGYYTSSASAINVRVGTLGGSAVASSLTLSTVTLSVQAAVVSEIVSPITATGIVSMLGSITATATLGVNSPSVVTITPSVTTFASAQAVAYLGPEAIAPVLKYSLSPAYDRYLDVVEAGTPYDSSSGVYADVTSVATSFRPTINIGVPSEYVTGPSVTLFAIFRTISGLSSPTQGHSQSAFGPSISSNEIFPNAEFLTASGNWVYSTSVTQLSAINLKNEWSNTVSRGFYYVTSDDDNDGNYKLSKSSFSDFLSFKYFTGTQDVSSANGFGYFYSALVLKSGQVSSALTTAYPYTVCGVTVSTLGINIGPAYVEGYANGAGVFIEPMIGQSSNHANGLVEVRTNVSAGYESGFMDNAWFLGAVTASDYTGQDITLTFETMPDGKSQISGGSIAMSNYQHRPLEAKPKTGLVTVYPSKAYPGRRVQTIEISSCGAQYGTAPTVLISEPEDENGVTAKATAQINNGKLSGITITDPGSGYSAAPDVFVLPPVSQMKYGAPRTVTSVVSALDRRLELAMASGTTISENSWAILNGLGNANGLAYVVSVATGGTRTTLKFPYDLGAVTSVGTATLTPLVPYVRVTGATISGTDANFSVGSTIPVTFSTPSCGDTDAVAEFTVANSGQINLASIPTPGFATAFSVATISAYKKVTGITVTCAGSGYWTVTPSVTIDNAAYVATAPGATPASVTALLKGNGQISLSIVCAGYGYTTAPTITINAPNLGNGIRVVTVGTKGVGYSDGTFACSVAAAPAGGTDAIVNFVKSGSIQSFVVVNPGSGYTTTPAVTVPAPDLGGQVGGFGIELGGSGYTSAPFVQLDGGGGSGAAATAIITNGTVTSISLTEAGSGYTSAPNVTIEAPSSSVYYSKQIDLSGASVTSLLAGGSSASAYLQVEEKTGANTTVLAQVPVTLVARVS